MKRCLSYLKGTKALGLRYKRQNNNQGLIAYCDADFRRSTSGHIITYNGGMIAWRNKLQHMAATSTTEAEFLSLIGLIKVVISLRDICRELRLINDEPTEILCDNRGAILVAVEISWSGTFLMDQLTTAGGLAWITCVSSDHPRQTQLVAIDAWVV